MTAELDPKLRDFEAKLRRLKPLASRSGVPAKWTLAKFAAVCRLPSAVCAAAVILLAIVCLIPRQQPQPVPPMVELAIPVAVKTVSEELPTMRQQLAQLLDEMNVADAVPEKKPVYPVVEIAVCDVRSQESGDRSQKLGVKRWGPTEYDMILSF
jgi:hypothetical protein